MAHAKAAACYPDAREWKRPSNGVNGNAISLSVIALCALQVGTGGSMDANFLKSRGEKGYALPGLEIHARRDNEGNRSSILTPSQEIIRLIDSFGLSIAELSSLFDVSRQAIYDWKSGKSLSTSNLQRLSDISNAMLILETAGATKSHQVLQRPIRDGKSFVDLVSAGNSATEMASYLIKILAHEKAEADQLNSLFANRKPSSSNFFADMDPSITDSEA